MQAYTIAPKVGQKRPFLEGKAEGQMSRAGILFIIIVIILAGALWFLSTQAREVPAQPVEIDVTNAVGN